MPSGYGRVMIPGLLERVDCVVGDSIERAMTAHHRRRLRRVGWEHALSASDAGWVDAGEPPSAGNAIEVLVDGGEALPRMAEAIAGARSHVHIAGWCVTPDFALTADEPPVILHDLLADAARRVPVRVLLWGGAPLPMYPVSRRAVRSTRDALCKDSAVVCALDTHERPLHCHHEKLVIVDDELAFVGGIDLTDFAGNRLDRPRHPPQGKPRLARRRHRPPRSGGRGRQPSFRPALERSGGRAAATTGRASPGRRPGTADRPHRPRAHLQGIAAGRVLDPRELRGRPPLRASTSSIWRTSSCGRPRSWRSSGRSCATPPSDRFRLLLVLPAKPNSGADDTTGQLGLLADADDGAGRMLACTRYAVADGASDRVYVHAKVGIVDDRWLTVGSANLNEHSLFNDTEMNVVSHDPALARATRLRLWGEHLARPAETLEGDPATLIDEVWRPLATEQLERRTAGAQLTHGLVGLAHVSRRSKRLLGPLQSLLVDG